MTVIESPALTDSLPEFDERTRQRLLLAAVRVFDRKGYAAASVREIVELAGTTKPTLYYHFGSKEGLLAAVLDVGLRRFTDAMARAVARPGSTRARLMMLCEEVFRLMQENVPAVRVAHVLFFGPAEAAPRYDFTRFDSSLREALQRIVADGLAAGEVPPANPADVALAVTGVIGACAARQLHPGFRPVDVEGLRRVLDLVFDGILNGRRHAGEGRR